MPQLHVIIGSTRPGRVGEPIGKWFAAHAKTHAGFDVSLIDLAEVNLPMFDEPHHPKLRKYQHEHTKKWSASIEAADAFVFVTPEYNHAPPPALVNAIDYLVVEWNYKPAAFVSYGGISGGTRAVQLLKPMLAGLKVVSIPEAVVIPMFTQHMEDGAFRKNLGVHEQAATTALDELAKWTPALKSLREG